MRRIILIIAVVLPLSLSAQIPAIEQLGKEAKRQRGVEYESVGSLMLGLASTFAAKDQRATFEMLDNIDMITCTNSSYTPTLRARAQAVVESIGATYLDSTEDDKARSVVYAIKQEKVVKELIILTEGKDGGYAVVVMSGTIPEERLEEISKLSPPHK